MGSKKITKESKKNRNAQYNWSGFHYAVVSNTSHEGTDAAQEGNGSGLYNIGSPSGFKGRKKRLLRGSVDLGREKVSGVKPFPKP